MPARQPDRTVNRRELLTVATAAASLAAGVRVRSAPRRQVVGDYSGLTAVPVAEERRPVTANEVSDAEGG